MSVSAEVGGDAPAVLVAGYRRRRRRQWTIAQKLTIVREIAESGDPVAEVARRHGMNANQLFSWRQQARSGALAESAAPPERRTGELARTDFVEMGVVGAPAPLADGAETIEVALPSGVVVRVPASATGKPLRSALAAIRAAGL
jgi:transposase